MYTGQKGSAVQLRGRRSVASPRRCVECGHVRRDPLRDADLARTCLETVIAESPAQLVQVLSQRMTSAVLVALGPEERCQLCS